MRKDRTSPPSQGRVAEATRNQEHAERLAVLIEHCIAAQTIADVQGEKFLSYMLAMTIEAARGVTRGRGSG